MSTKTIKIQLSKTTFLLEPNSQYTIRLDEGFCIDDYETPNLPKENLISFTTNEFLSEVTVDPYNVNNSKTITITFNTSVSYREGGIYLYDSSDTLIQSWTSAELNSIVGQQTIVLNITDPFNNILNNESYYLLLDENAFISNLERVLIKSNSWPNNEPQYSFTTGSEGLGIVTATMNSILTVPPTDFIRYRDTNQNLNSVSSFSVEEWIYRDFNTLTTIYHPKSTLNGGSGAFAANDNFGISVACNNNIWAACYNQERIDIRWGNKNNTQIVNESIPGKTIRSLAMNDKFLFLYTLESGIYVAETRFFPTLLEQSTFGVPFAGGPNMSVNKNNVLITGNPAFNSNEGRIYVYEYSADVNNIYNLKYVIDNPAPATSSEFGRSVSIEDKYFAVQNSINTYIYSIETGLLINTIPNQTIPGNIGTMSIRDGILYYINFDNGYAFDILTGNQLFTLNGGRKIVVDDQWVAIAKYTVGDFNGEIYLYEKDTHTLVKTITNPNTSSDGINDGFGFGLAISTDIIIVGAPYKDQPGASGTTNSNEGVVYKYT